MALHRVNFGGQCFLGPTVNVSITDGPLTNILSAESDVGTTASPLTFGYTLLESDAPTISPKIPCKYAVYIMLALTRTGAGTKTDNELRWNIKKNGSDVWASGSTYYGDGTGSYDDADEFTRSRSGAYKNVSIVVGGTDNVWEVGDQITLDLWKTWAYDASNRILIQKAYIQLQPTYIGYGLGALAGVKIDSGSSSVFAQSPTSSAIGTTTMTNTTVVTDTDGPTRYNVGFNPTGGFTSLVEGSSSDNSMVVKYPFYYAGDYGVWRHPYNNMSDTSFWMGDSSISNLKWSNVVRTPHAIEYRHVLVK